MLRYALLLALTFTPLLAASASDSTPAVSGAWVREMPPVADNAAGYLRIDNPGPRERRLVGAHHPGFERIEIHETERVDGTMRMRRRASLTVPAGGRAVLRPGGYHLMLMGRRMDPPRAGDRLELELEFADGVRIPVTAEVARHRPEGGAGGDDAAGAR